jgi:hypothetical protein
VARLPFGRLGSFEQNRAVVEVEVFGQDPNCFTDPDGALPHQEYNGGQMDEAVGVRSVQNGVNPLPIDSPTPWLRSLKLPNGNSGAPAKIGRVVDHRSGGHEGLSVPGCTAGTWICLARDPTDFLGRD